MFCADRFKTRQTYPPGYWPDGFVCTLLQENEKTDSDNPTIGIILCSQKNETIVKYSVLKESKQLFASKYKLYLPTEEELKNEVNEEITKYNQYHSK